VDQLDAVWQAVRPLGLESELRDRHQLKPARATLQPRRSVSRLAARLDEPHLAAIVASTAYRLGSVPDRTPGWCAVELSVARTFGRWQIQSDDPAGPSGRSSVLVETLAGRLALRKVTVHLERAVTEVLTTGGRVSGIRTLDGTRTPAAAVISTLDPWRTAELLPQLGTERAERGRRRRRRPALAPTISHRLDPTPADVSPAVESPALESLVRETVALSDSGVPTITYSRPVTSGTLHSVHDYRHTTPDPGVGLAWNGFRSWLDRPRVTTDLSGFFTAGPFSPGGSSPSSVVLSGALASYGCHDYLS